MMQLNLQKKQTIACRACFNEIKIDSFHSLFNLKTYVCSKCLKEMNPYFKNFKVDGINALALYRYHNLIKEKIYLLKGCNDIELAPIFLTPYKFELETKYRGFIMIPAPSFEEDNIKRGFNHVEEIFKNLNLKVVKAISKIDKVKQSDLNFSERRKIKNHYKIDENIDLKNKKILIVDDICTTGSTLKSMISLIKIKEPKKIEILVIAKRDFSQKEKEKIGKNIEILE